MGWLSVTQTLPLTERTSRTFFSSCLRARSPSVRPIRARLPVQSSVAMESRISRSSRYISIPRAGLTMTEAMAPASTGRLPACRSFMKRGR